MNLGPFDLTGGPFLALYSVVLVLAGLASLLIPRMMRGQGRPGQADGQDDLAFLAGDVTRLAEAAVARLLESGALVQQGRSQFMTVVSDAGKTPVERAILGMARPAGWGAILRAVAAEAMPIERRLVAKGLLLDSATQVRLRLTATLPLLLALGFGAIKLLVGVSRGKPVGYLVALLLITAVLGAMRFAKLDRRTREGQQMLAQERVISERLRRAPQRSEMGRSVALFGTAVLAGSALSNFDAMRRNTSGSDGSSGCSGSAGGDGGGGCGGGGCGGCGGS